MEWEDQLSAWILTAGELVILDLTLEAFIHRGVKVLANKFSAMVIGRVQKKQFNIIYFLRNNLRLYYGAKIVFLANGAGTTSYSDAKKKKKESRHSPYTITKMNSNGS